MIQKQCHPANLVFRFNYYSPIHHTSQPCSPNLHTPTLLTHRSQDDFCKSKANFDQQFIKRTEANVSSFKQTSMQPYFESKKRLSVECQQQLNQSLSQSVIMKTRYSQSIPLSEINSQNKSELYRQKRRTNYSNFQQSASDFQSFQSFGESVQSLGYNQNLVQKSDIKQVVSRVVLYKQNPMSFTFTKHKSRLRKQIFKLSNAQIEDFVIGQKLGKGTVGQVYLAKHKMTGFYFALKKVRKSDIKNIQQFIIGLKGHFYLNHPNICRLYACFYDKTHIYMLLELGTHGSLQKYNRKIQNDQERDHIISGISKGLQFMHKAYLRHGDLKLQNILICHGFPKITDFDCLFYSNRKEVSEARRKSKLWGSPAYFSPDMMNQSIFALQDDVWSLGVIMYEIYCNGHPFDIQNTNDLQKIINKEMNPFPKHIKSKTQQLIKKMLDKKRQNRATLDQILNFCC